MFHLVVNLIHQRIPIGQLLATFLKVRAVHDVVQEHRMEVERVVRTCEGDDPLEVVVVPSFLDGVPERERGLALAFFDVVFLTPQGTARHGKIVRRRRRGGGWFFFASGQCVVRRPWISDYDTLFGAEPPF